MDKESQVAAERKIVFMLCFGSQSTPPAKDEWPSWKKSHLMYYKDMAHP